MIVLLRDFLSGKVGRVVLGMNASQIETYFGQPDDQGGTSRKYKWPCVWKYGDFEFHFDRQTRSLDMIYAELDEDIESITGGRHFEIQPDILNRSLSKNDFIKILNQNNIDYYEECGINDSEVQIKTLNASVLFEHSMEASKLWCIAIGKSGS